VAKNEIRRVVDELVDEQERHPKRSLAQLPHARRLQDIANRLRGVLNAHFYDFGPEEIDELTKMQQRLIGISKKYE
jgi:hypothetical protein